MIYTIRLHEVSPFLSYLGKAAVGSLETDPVWQIAKLETIAGIFGIMYPEGEFNFGYVWEDHEALTYQ